MLKPTKSYRMSKQHKIMLNWHKDPHLRGSIKRSIIQADLEAEIAAKKQPKENRNLPNVSDLDD